MDSNQGAASPADATVIHSMKGHQLAQYIRDLYESGARIYTKDMLLDLDAALSSTEPGHSLKIRCMNGSFKTEKVPISSNKDHTIRVAMLDFHDLIERAETAFTTQLLTDEECGITEEQKTLSTCPIKIESLPADAAQRQFIRLESAWHMGWLNWGTNPIHKELRKFLKALGPKTPEISQVVCLGLGPLGGFKDDVLFGQKVGDGQAKYRNITQHMFVSTVAKAIGDHFGKHDLPLIVSDPEYTENDKKILSKAGMKVVEGFGVRGLTLIDSKTLVISFSPSFPLKQVLADTTMPAALVWDQVLSAPSSKRYGKASPHVRRLCQEYDEHHLAVEPSRFGNITIYTRKPLIKNLAEAMEAGFNLHEMNRMSDVESIDSDVEDVDEVVIVYPEIENGWVVLE